MNTGSKTQNSRRIYRVWLYSVVFASKLSAVTVMFLFLSFFIQPFHRALANEALPEEVVEPDPVAEDVKVQPEELPEEVVIAPENEPPAVEDEVIVDEITSDGEGDTEDVEVNAVSDGDVNVPDDAEKEFLEPPPDLPPENEASDTSASTTTEIEPDIPIEDPPLATSSPPTDVSTTSVQTDLPDPPDSASADLGSSTVSTTTEPAGEVLGESTVSSTTPSSNDEPSSGGGAGEADNEDPSATDQEGSSGADAEGGADDSASDSIQPPVDTGDDESASDFDVAPVTDSSGGSGGGSSADDPPQSDIVEAEASSTADEVLPEAGTVVQAQYLVTEENYYQFSQQSCVAVGDGTFHCSLNTDEAVDEHAVVYAEADEDGDMEIYIRTGEDKVEKLTENQLDDTAPHLDADSMQVVWQRLIDGRYQIISYDLKESKETQLTFSRNNNMEPKVAAEGIVWQAWDENDWEIMYFDGTYTEQITDNDAQDVTPVIEDGYILWSILGGASQEARVYSLESNEIMAIAGHDGGAIANPRFVLVYDTKFDNGDVVTQSFDPTTGLSAIIAALPYSEPINIPPVDTTGEIKALIQNKSTQKEDLASDGVQHDDLDTLSTSDLVAPSDNSSEDTLNLKSDPVPIDAPDLETASTTVPVVEVAEIPPLELTEFDLVIVSTTTPDGLPEVSTTSSGVVSSTQG